MLDYTFDCGEEVVLTLHTEPIGAVLGLENGSLTVFAPVFGGGRAALSASPVGAFRTARRPFTPIGPQAIH